MSPTVEKNTTKQHIMIVAGEASGDMHGANLLKAIQAEQGDLYFSGLGGPELGKAGMELLYDASKLAVVGITEVISHLGDILAARKALIKKMKEEPPALLILIDYPDFNLFLAAKAKKLGIPIFYYISPQVWAWRSKRAKKIGRLADRIGVILPFEKEFYKERAIEVDYVGHPLLDIVKTTMTREEFLAHHNIDSSDTVIGLLPGSRTKEISSLLPDFLEAAFLLKEKLPQNIAFLLPRAATISRKILEDNGLDKYQDQINIRVIDDNRYNLMAACDVAVAASGTVTLELALLDTPLIATYRFSPRTYYLGKILVKFKFFSLVNLIADKEVIPELLQDQVSPESICNNLYKILADSTIHDTMKKGLSEVRTLLGTKGASTKAAKIALETFKP